MNPEVRAETVTLLPAWLFQSVNLCRMWKCIYWEIYRKTISKQLFTALVITLTDSNQYGCKLSQQKLAIFHNKYGRLHQSFAQTIFALPVSVCCANIPTCHDIRKLKTLRNYSELKQRQLEQNLGEEGGGDGLIHLSNSLGTVQRLNRDFI